jgi:predicted nuclease with TOPRIM domain
MKLSAFCFFFALAPVTASLAMSDSMLRPRVQLAQLRAEVDELLELTNTHSIAQIKRTIKELQNKLNSATAENAQLRARLETQKQEYAQTQQRNKQLSQSLKELTVFKKKTSSHFEALRTLIDAVPDSVP